jgi:hypothetical protein
MSATFGDALATARGHIAMLKVSLAKLADDRDVRVAERKALAAEHYAAAKKRFDDLCARKKASGEGFSQADLDMLPDAVKSFEANTPHVPAYPLAAKMAAPRAEEAIDALKSAVGIVERSIADYEKACVRYDEERVESARRVQKAAAEAEKERLRKALARRREEDSLLAQAEKLGLDGDSAKKRAS